MTEKPNKGNAIVTVAELKVSPNMDGTGTCIVAVGLAVKENFGPSVESNIVVPLPTAVAEILYCVFAIKPVIEKVETLVETTVCNKLSELS